MTNPHGPYTADEARNYDRDRESEVHWHLENQFVATLLDRHPGREVLDVPIGTGRFLRLYENRSVVGADLSQPMLREAELRGRQVTGLEVTLVRASITDLPFEASRFDLIVCWRMLHLLPPEVVMAAFAELARVCRGTVCIQCYLPGTWVQRNSSRLWRWLRRLMMAVRGEHRLTPWSHITNYAHPAKFIEAAAAAVGLQLDRAETIATYEGSRVVAMEWSVKS